MPVITTALGSRLQVVVQTGTDSEGNPLLENRSYNRIKSGATNDSVYQFAAEIAGLQQHPLFAVNRTNEVGLEQV
ncbi:MAG: DUF1659 domain-containing protein [Bacillota bacterium]